MPTPPTPRHHRSARAEATLAFGAEVREALEESTILHTARVAGVMAARRASELMPYSGAAELTEVDVAFEWADAGLRVLVALEGFSRRGLGSRALLAANVCAATIVDMLPAHAESIGLDSAQITEQRGGMQGLSYDFDPPVRAAVVVVSDAVAGGHKEDRAGAIVRERVEAMGEHGVELADYEIIGDDAEALDATLERLVSDGADLVLTVGGTGLAHTDVTVEVVEPKLERHVPGLMELVRGYGQQLTPVAFMSRGVAGLIGDTLVLTLPGSRGGARESCEALFPAVLHVFKTLRKSRAVL